VMKAIGFYVRQRIIWSKFPSAFIAPLFKNSWD